MQVDRYERLWMWAATAMLAVFIGAIVVTAVAGSNHPPSHTEVVNPDTLGVRGEFATPGVTVHPDGSRTVVFTTTPPGVETEDAMRALVTWYGQNDAVHPLVRVAAFCYEFVTIHPFQDGNGRLSRLLATLLLLQQGYPWVQYVSFEHEIEQRKNEYYRVLRTCQAQRPGEDIGPWLHFFLDCLVVMMEKLRAKLQIHGAITGLNERQRSILRYVQAHAGAQAGGIAASMSVPLPTVKKDLEALVRSGAILRAGAGRGTSYTAP